MYLSALQVKGFRLFKNSTTIKLHRGLNLLMEENGYRKSSVIDAIPILLTEEIKRWDLMELDSEVH